MKPWQIGLIIGLIALGILGGLWFYYVYKRVIREVPTASQAGETQMMMTQLVEEHFFAFMEFSKISEATNNFTTELGRGGFGIVYKGILESGIEVAVKRLIIHKNLVRLLGCCCEGNEKILVYEFLPNSSLDRYIFEESQRGMLNWEKRFIIINEIAQGLDYLHHLRDSPIIHRDLKPSNILLDRNMSAKISDFGMSTTLQRGQTESESDIMVGTYGYMSEEYVLHNLISEKSDIFSFGVTIMEIVTGKKNYTFCNANPGDSILDLSWRKWSEDNVLELLDSNFEDDATLVPEQVLRCVQIGLCCVQDQVEDRPSSDSVLLMLRRGLQIPLPKPLDYFYAKSLARFYANNNNN